MKICFNLFPPANKLIALLVCLLLILSYTRLKAETRLNNFKNTEKSAEKNINNLSLNTTVEKQQIFIQIKSLSMIDRK